MLSYSLCPRSTEDFCEIRLHVDFDNRLLMPLGVLGIGFEEAACFDVLLYGRERCHPNCRLTACPKCRPRVLYQDCALKPTGPGLAFSPHSEYLYCLKCHKRPATALLSLTPHEQDVEVKELGLLACWFATWFQRANASATCRDAGAAPTTPVASEQQQEGKQHGEQLQGQVQLCGQLDVQEAEEEEEEEHDDDDLNPKQTLTSAVADAAAEAALNWQNETASPERSLGNLTSKYLPNMRITYQVRKERMTVSLPEPSQLARCLDVQLVCRKESSSQQVQTATLQPGDDRASCELIAVRDTPYTIKVKLHDQGRPLELLDLVTERKVLRVQESRLAPKYMNFLMERRVDQRATFVLHITFDERAIDVGNQWLGEFFLDVDSEKNTLAIGTVRGYERKIYRVEKLMGRPEDGTAGSDQRVLVFEGGVDNETLFTPDIINLQQQSDYLVSVVDPDTQIVLPTSVLSFRRSSLYVKEIKGGDVRLHVAVQREVPSAISASNDNNLDAVAIQQQLRSNSAQVFQRQSDGTFYCPLGRSGGSTRYRILHMSSRRLLTRRSGRGGLRSTSRCSATTAAAAATDAALEAADASTYSCGGGSRRYDDSGLGRNQSSLSEGGLDVSTAATMCQAGICMHLDVDLTKLKARLLPPRDGRNASNEVDEVSSNCCYLIVEEPRLGGKVRSTPCQLGQEFAVSRWCRYTVKAIEVYSVSPLFTFRLTDRDVTDVKQCGLQPVQLTQSVAR